MLQNVWFICSVGLCKIFCYAVNQFVSVSNVSVASGHWFSCSQSLDVLALDIFDYGVAEMQF